MPAEAVGLAKEKGPPKKRESIPKKESALASALATILLPESVAALSPDDCQVVLRKDLILGLTGPVAAQRLDSRQEVLMRRLELLYLTPDHRPSITFLPKLLQRRRPLARSLISAFSFEPSP